MNNLYSSDDGDDNTHDGSSDSSDFSGDEERSSESDDTRDSKPSKKYQDDYFESPLQSLESELYVSPRIYSSKFLDQGTDATLLNGGSSAKIDDSIGKTIKAATLKLSSPQIYSKHHHLNREISISAGNLPALTTTSHGPSKFTSHFTHSLQKCSFEKCGNSSSADQIAIEKDRLEDIHGPNHSSPAVEAAEKLEVRRRKRRCQKLHSYEEHPSSPESVQKFTPSLKLSPFLNNFVNELSSSPPKKSGEESLVDSPTERHIFFKSFSHLVRQGRRGKQNGSCRFKRMDSMDEQLAPKTLKHFLWLELLAWHRNRPVEQQEVVLSLQRQAIASTLEDIYFFYVRDAGELTKLKKSFTPSETELNLHCDEDSGVSIVTDQTCADPDFIPKRSTDESSKRNKTPENLYKRKRRVSAVSDHGNKTGIATKCESGLQLFRRKESVVGEAKSMQEVVECLEKMQLESSEEKRSESSTSSEISGDDSRSSSALNDELTCECSDTLSRVCQTCVSKETDTLEQVAEATNKLDKIEHLYPSSLSLAEHYPIYSSEEFSAKVKTLNLWYNITVDIRQKINLLASLFGIRSRSKAGWPCYTEEENLAESRSDEILKDEAQKVFPPLKQVHFKTLTPTTSSPSSSGSDWSERSRSSVPPSPDIKLGNPFEMPGYGHSSVSSVMRLATELGSSHSIYRRYVDHTLRHKGLKHLYRQLSSLMCPILYRVHATLKKPKPSSSEKAEAKVVTDTPSSSEKASDSLLPYSREYFDELSKYGVWSESFQQMSLPTFHRPFFFLLRVFLDVVHECLLLRLDQQPIKPSSLSVGQLIKECKEVLRAATQTRQRYINLAQTVLGDGGSEIIEAQFDCFDKDLERMLQVYLDYLQQRVLMMQNISQLTLHQKSYLEEEWVFVRVICPHIPGGEALAAKRFCFMSRYLLSSIGLFLNDGINECFSSFYDSTTTEHEYPSSYRKSILYAFRQFKFIFHECCERARQVITFAKTLRKDLEIATEFKLLVSPTELLLKLRETGHIRVIAPHTSSHAMFIPGNLQHCEMFIWQLVDMTCGHEVLDPGSDQAIYLIMMQCDKCDLHVTYWDGPTIVLEPTAEATITLSHVEVDGLLLVVNHSSQLVAQCKKFQKVMGNTLQIDKQQTSCNHAIAEALGNLKSEALELWGKISQVVKDVETKLDVASLQGLDDLDRMALGIRCIEVLHQGFRFGFEYQKAVTRLITGEARVKFSLSLAHFAQQWMKFVAEKCEQGRGLRPRWVKQGLEFLVAVYDQTCIQLMPEEDFIVLRKNLNDCIRHLLGSSEKSPIASHVTCSPRASGIYSARTPFSYNLIGPRSQSFSTSRSDSLLSSSGLNSSEDWATPKGLREQALGSENPCNGETVGAALPIERARRAISMLEQQQQEKLERRGVIGRVSEIVVQKTPLHISARRVTFPWQRCFKIGEGRFGKVYTAVNNATGELIAMKEIRLQPNDHRAIKGAMDEIRTFEGIKHKNLVRYYGVEMHREEMLIFMEYCNEGSLESAAQLRLPESLIRKYTRQLLKAVNVLHEHGIVHRDIKSANIFLTSDGNIKLGDFGCSIKLKNNSTLPGELCGFVGTPAYMAPEIFTKNMQGGHGRVADVWSIGCVVLEMVTSLRPWHELENSYQIMFTVGMGGIPEIPADLSDEGKDFLSHCLVYNPQERWSTCQLLDHPFTKVHEDEYS